MTRHARPNYKSALGYPGYRIGDDGTVWSEWKMKGMGYGRKGSKQYRSGIWKRLKPDLNRGRPRVRLRVAEKTYKAVMVHRLVLEAFVGPCPDNCEAVHFDGDPANNRLDNLRWDTHSANLMGRRDRGTSRSGEDSPVSVLTEREVLEIRSRAACGESEYSIAQDYICTRENLRFIIDRKTWQHLKR